MAVGLDAGGTGATAYAQAVGAYLALGTVDRWGNSFKFKRVGLRAIPRFGIMLVSKQNAIFMGLSRGFNNYSYRRFYKRDFEALNKLPLIIQEGLCRKQDAQTQN